MKIKHAWCIDNNRVPVLNDEIKRYLSVRPSERQLLWHDMKYYNFIHFGVNTFTNREWGDGTEDVSIFNPTELDTDQWCAVLKDSGSKGIIFTAKHHDGFCLFNSKYTTHTIMNSPYGKDIVKQLSISCKKFGLKLGLYLSPWDRHEKTYGTNEYNDYFINQLTELCTNYGELFCFWFDGACGEGPNGKKQLYDWERYYEIIRQYQPNAVIANCGPDVRWIGNEAGKVRKSEWNIIQWTARTNDTIAEKSQKDEKTGLTSFDRVEEDLGSRKVLNNKPNLCWSPAEADLSINNGWFWHDDDYYNAQGKKTSRTAKELLDVYINTVGGNAAMLLNVPPDTKGLINDREIKTLNEFSVMLKSIFKENMPFELYIIDKNGEEFLPGAAGFMLQDNEVGAKITPVDKFRTMVIEEDIRYSQRIEAFDIFADGKKIAGGTTIGSGKILNFPYGIDADEVLFVVTQSRGNPIIKNIKLYK